MTTIVDMSYATSKIKDWAEKSGKNADELADKFSEILKKTVGKTEAATIRKSLSKLKSELQVNLNSQSIAYEIVILGKTPARDVMERKLKKLKIEYMENPAKFISDGSVLIDQQTKEPIFLDMTEKYGEKQNNNFMKPMKKQLYMSSLQLAVKKPNEDQTWQPGFMKLTGDLALSNDIPIGSQLTTRLLGNFNKETGRYELRASSETGFANSKSLTGNEIVEIIEGVYDDKFVFLGDALETFEVGTTTIDWEGFIVTEGTVDFMKLPTDSSTGNIGLGSESLEFGERITVFVDKSIESLLKNVKQKDNVIILGRFSPSKKYKDGQKTDEPTVLINAYAVYPQY